MTSDEKQNIAKNLWCIYLQFQQKNKQNPWDTPNNHKYKSVVYKVTDQKLTLTKTHLPSSESLSDENYISGFTYAITCVL